MTTDNRPRAVILTGGALPGDPAPEPHEFETRLIADRAEVGVDMDTWEGRVVCEAFRAGYERAAKDHAVRGVYLISGSEEDAKAFAAWVTHEIDPAYVTHLRDPLAEVLHGCEIKPEDPS